MDLLSFFSEQSFMPHGHCYLWSPALVAVQVVSNLLIGISYVVISALLALFVRRSLDLPLRWVYVAFGTFIISCGLTHFMDVLVIWYPRYWLDGSVRVVTAIASVGTALMLPKLLPQAMSIARGASLIRKRGLELESAVADLEGLYKQTLELDRLKTTFFANVSHELRTPLTLIIGPVEQLLTSTTIGRDERRELEVVARNARALVRQVNNLLDIAKLDAGKLEPRYARIDLAELVRFTAASFDSLARERSLRFSVIAPDALHAEVDLDKLQRVMLNLLSNAFKFTPHAGSVRIELGFALDHGPVTSAPRASLVVADSGPGVPVQERASIFERFRQGRGSAQHVGGTGLGLSIVREFVTLHGGNVFVDDAPEGGACFRVEVPVEAPANAIVYAPQTHAELETRAASTVDELRHPSVPENDNDAAGMEAPLVLLVEDNADMRALLVRTLSGLYRVAQAADGVEGLERARTLRPDLIVSDMMMPRMTGEGLVEALRADHTLDAIPILLLSANSDEALRTRNLQRGAQDYVLKPFTSAELLARVHNLLSVKRSRDLLQHEVETQQVDLEALSRQVVAQKRELSLSLATAREARQHAEQASRAKSDFLSLVSHELRTPLTAIQLQLERLRRGAAGTIGSDQARAVDTMSRSAARLLDLLETLLEFGRLESGGREVVVEAVDIGTLVADVVEAQQARAAQKGLTLRALGSDASVAVRSDAHLLRLLLGHLLDNALRYTERGEVTVLLERGPEGSARLQVRDTGPGIPEAQRERVFEPFQQLEQVRHKRESGVGLGLALVRSIAGVLGATVALESEVGQGSTFTVTLPRIAVAAA
ncbi:MAG: ATP-binding protein [Polyangiales bacterium]